MLKIAVCDDENVICSQVERYLNDSAEKFGIGIETDVFYSGEKFLDSLKSESYDIVFLDLVLKEISGQEVSRIIREEMHNEAIQIIYIAGMTEHAYELFEYDPILFLKKPLTNMEIEKAFLKIIKKFNLTLDTYTIRMNGISTQIRIKDIVYLESEKRKVKIVTVNNETFYFYGTIKESYEFFKKCDFLMIHNSYLINPLHIRQAKYEYVIMAGNVKLSIAQSKRTEIKNAFMKIL